MDQGQLGPWVRFASRSSSRRRLARAAGGGLAALLAARVTGSAASGQASTPCPATTEEDAEAIAEAYFAAFNAGDADALGALLAPDYRHHGALVSEQDRSLHQERLRTNREALPDGQYELADIFAQDDLVAIRHIFTGTLQRPYAGVEPAGQPVAVRGVHIHRVACGQIVETWNSGDALGLLRQIG
ncbi:MAG: ester cyclase, partial [Chloroflexi bacterium]|nr:ester cyclase [Chloroflexota bacterium]